VEILLSSNDIHSTVVGLLEIWCEVITHVFLSMLGLNFMSIKVVFRNNLICGDDPKFLKLRTEFPVGQGFRGIRVTIWAQAYCTCNQRSTSPKTIEKNHS
jgi:hypothetical protein